MERFANIKYFRKTLRLGFLIELWICLYLAKLLLDQTEHFKMSWMKEIKGRAMHAKKTTIHSFLCETLEGYIIFTQYPWCKQHMNFGVNNKESK